MSERLPAWVPGTAVALGTATFGWLNVHNARSMAPNWSQDLAFFQQIAHSAATGGPWASPLLLEPQGFFEMVHTHLVSPLVFAGWALVPRMETLLVFQALFVSLALWPALRLGEAAGGRRLGLAAVAALALFGPFQAAATADFRPSVLFIPGLIGVFAAARGGSWGQALLWGGVALLGRQEASYLLGFAGLGLLLVPWGGRRQWQTAAALLALAALSFGLWVLLKPNMFFHLDPFHRPPPVALDAETLGQRWTFLGWLARSGGLLGLLSPASLVAGLPIAWEMKGTPRTWSQLTGPTAHYAAFWLPFVAASAIAGAGRVPWGLGPLLLVVLNAFSFPWITPREGPRALLALREAVRPEDRVAADYDTIHVLAGRDVLWNIEQLDLPDQERPHGWDRDWPIRFDEVDVIVMPIDHRHAPSVAAWTVEATADRHVLLRRPPLNSPP